MPTSLHESTALLRERRSLDSAQATEAAQLLADEGIDPLLKAEFLTLLAEKGESVEEITAFARTFRAMARAPLLRDDWAESGIDVCGTGGDKAGSFNISSMVTLILASGGVPVLKHGNRSITSRSGSSDFFEALGLPMPLPDQWLESCLEELGYTFFFAPAFHPAFKSIVPVRRELAARGQRTIFNILGPLINPARPARQLLGVFSADLVPTLAGVLHALGIDEAMVVHGKPAPYHGLDELSSVGENLVIRASRQIGLLPMETWRADDFGLPTGNLAELSGGDAAENVAMAEQLVRGIGPRTLIDSVCLGAAAAFFISQKVSGISEGIILARDLLLGGPVAEVIEKTRQFGKRISAG